MKASIAEIAEKDGLNQKTVRKWRKRQLVDDAPMDPKSPPSTALSSKE